MTFSRPVALARLLGQHLGVRARVDALDLPDVDLDAEVLAVLDRAAHQLRTQLGVVAVGVAADGLELVVLGGHEQLEQEQATVVVEPVGELLEAAELALVHLRVAVRVVTDEHLGGERVELLDVRAEVARRTGSRTRSGRTSRPASSGSGRARAPARGRRRRTARRPARRPRRRRARARPRPPCPRRSASWHR